MGSQFTAGGKCGILNETAYHLLFKLMLITSSLSAVYSAVLDSMQRTRQMEFMVFEKLCHKQKAYPLTSS